MQQLSVMNTLLFDVVSLFFPLMFACSCWRSSKETGTPRATMQQVLDALVSPKCCDKVWCNLGTEEKILLSSFSGYIFSFFKTWFSRTFSTTDTVVDGNVLLLPPVFPCQCASVVCCCVEVMCSVIWENVPTFLIGFLGQQGPICCHKLTAEGWIWSRTVCIMAV